MKTIGIDIRVLAKGTRTGIEEYVLNLLSFLLSLDQSASKQDKKIKYKLFYNGFRKVKLNYPWLNFSNVELKKSKIPNRILDFCMKLFNWPKIDKILNGVDIFFSPHFLPIALSKTCKRVITFHDISFKYHPQFFSKSRKLWHFLTFPKSQAQKADKIIVDSQSTKEDLIKIYKIDPEKIKVIYLGVSNNFKPIKNTFKLNKVKQKYNLPDSFVLYFGTIEPRKNLKGLIKAFDNLKQKFIHSDLQTTWEGFEGVVIGKKKNIFKDLKLVIAGEKGWLYKDIFEKAKNAKSKNDIIFTGFIEDQDKPYLYNLANIFVYPSFFEGFGFPPLEAMASGVPTIVSNTSSLPEVVGDGAIKIDPYKIEELTYAIRKVLEDSELRDDLIKKGIKQARKFDWNKTAKEVLKIFYKIK